LKQWSHWNSQICKNWPNCAKFNQNMAKLANFTNKISNRPFCIKFGTLVNFGTTFTLKKSNFKNGQNCAKFFQKMAKLANFTNKISNWPIHTKFDTLVNSGTNLPLKKSNSVKTGQILQHSTKMWLNWPASVTRVLIGRFAWNLGHWSVLAQCLHRKSHIWENCAPFGQ